MAREVAEAEARRFGRAAGLLSVGVGSAGLLTYVYFSLASHNLDRVEYGEVVVLWSAVFITISTLFRPVEQLLSRTIAERQASERADRAAAARRRDDPARPRRRVRPLCARPPGAPPRGPSVRRRGPVLDPGHRRGRVQRQLLRARLPGRQPALHPVRPAALGRVHGPGLVCARGRRRPRQRPDGRRARDRRRAPAQPGDRPTRLRAPSRGPKPRRAGRAGGAPDRVSPSSPLRREAASPPRCS